MKKEELLELYKKLGNIKIDELYYFSCLLLSGFNEDIAYENIYLLEDLFFKDENGTSVSTLSDMLYEKYDEINKDEMTTREILLAIYQY